MLAISKPVYIALQVSSALEWGQAMGSEEAALQAQVEIALFGRTVTSLQAVCSKEHSISTYVMY